MSETFTFPNRQIFRNWLKDNGSTSEGVWLLFGKKGGPKTLTATQALEEALCYGWIDGQMQKIDDTCYKKYFAKRREKSNWSDKNKKLIQTLTEKGLMAKEGLQAIETAKKNGSWDKARYPTISADQIDQLKEIIQPYEPAFTNLKATSPSVQRTYTAMYFDAKTEKTRKTRLEKIIDRLNKNLKPM